LAVPDAAGHKVERRQIRTGSRRPGEVEVLDGLEEGDLAITHGTLRVRPGQAVTVRALDKGGQPLAELLAEPPTTVSPGRAE
jgi:membrane fusion protein (multidrug efflux system)